MSLRSKVIRLAYQRPELRPHLLPLVKTAAWTKEQWLDALDELHDKILPENRPFPMMRHGKLPRENKAYNEFHNMVKYWYRSTKGYHVDNLFDVSTHEWRMAFQSRARFLKKFPGLWKAVEKMDRNRPKDRIGF
jgi:hypothetical protein